MINSSQSSDLSSLYSTYLLKVFTGQREDSCGYALKTIGWSMKPRRLCLSVESNVNVHSSSVKTMLVSFNMDSMLTLLPESNISRVASLQLVSMWLLTNMEMELRYANTKFTSHIAVYFAIGGRALYTPLIILLSVVGSTLGI